MKHRVYRPCECGNEKPHPLSTSCLECERIEADRYQIARRGIIDHVRTLLKHHYPDWIDGAEVRAVLNDKETSSALWKLIGADEVERRETPGMGIMYRLKQQRRAA
jgi:hypothetical protein